MLLATTVIIAIMGGFIHLSAAYRYYAVGQAEHVLGLHSGLDCSTARSDSSESELREACRSRCENSTACKEPTTNSTIYRQCLRDLGRLCGVPAADLWVTLPRDFNDVYGLGFTKTARHCWNDTAKTYIMDFNSAPQSESQKVQWYIQGDVDPSCDGSTWTLTSTATFPLYCEPPSDATPEPDVRMEATKTGIHLEATYTPGRYKMIKPKDDSAWRACFPSGDPKHQQMVWNVTSYLVGIEDQNEVEDNEICRWPLGW